MKVALRLSIIALVTMVAFSCSESNDENQMIDSSFEPIEITFSEGFFTDCNQVMDIDGAKVSFVGISENENSCSLEIGSCSWNDNIFPNGFTTGNGSTDPALALFGGILEIDISDLQGASKATITIDDNCGTGCTKANLYEGNEVVSTVGNTVLGKDLEDLTLALNNDSSAIRLWSCEGAVIKIILE